MKYWRRLPKFEYLAPESIKEVCSILAEKGGDAKLMAGGTILLSRWKERQGVTPYLIGLKKVESLDQIDYQEGVGLKIGAMVTHRMIANFSLIREKFEPLATACAGLGSPQIRNMGTIGGNLCSRFPAAEVIPPLIALGARVKIVKSEEEKVIPVEELHKEPLKAELLTEIQIPFPPSGSGGTYLKYTLREALDYPTVSVAVQINKENGKCKDARIVVGAASPFPFRAEKAEKILKGNPVGEEVIVEAGEIAWEEARPSSDMYFSGDYKRELIKVLTKRAIKEAWEKAKIA